jgi:hypothetical protein
MYFNEAWNAQPLFQRARAREGERARERERVRESRESRESDRERERERQRASCMGHAYALRAKQ